MAKNPRIYLKRGRANPIWHGHPWVYSGAVEREEGAAEPGAIIDVCDVDGKYIGRGVVNPRSQIRARVLTRKDEPIDAGFLKARINEARAARKRIGLPSSATTAYRLVNSEGDGLSGLIVDVYGDVVAVQFAALGMKLLEQPIYDALEALLAPRAVVEVSAGSFADKEGFVSATRVVRGAGLGSGEVPAVSCLENGLAYEVDVLNGQKTGFFLDQRENRRRLAEFVGAGAKGARVLDLYAYAGGFALNALSAGAAAAVCVDSSSRAIERIRRHAGLNKLDAVDAVESDVFRWLEQARPRGFDVVVCDPPKFARAKKDLEPAIKGYERLNSLALNTCAENALFVTCSCSQLVDGETFERIIAAAAQQSGRRVRLLELTSQAPDHVVLPAFSEGRYLKVAFCHVV